MMITLNNLIKLSKQVKFLLNLKAQLNLSKIGMKVLIQTMEKIKMEKTIFQVLFKIILRNLIRRNIY